MIENPIKTMENFKIKTPNGNISWKRTADNLLNALNNELDHQRKEYETDFLCPNCDEPLYESGSEVYCKKCPRIDWLISDLLAKLDMKRAEE